MISMETVPQNPFSNARTRPVRRFVILACAALISVIATLAAFASTETGSSWAVRRLLPAAIQGLTVETVQGNLISGLTLGNVRLTANPFTTKIDHVAFRWRPLSLLRGMVRISDTEMTGVRIFLPDNATPPPKDAAGIADLMVLPIPLVFENASLEGIQLRHRRKVGKLDRVTLTGRLDHKGLRVHKLMACAPDVQWTARGDLALRPPYPFKGDVAWRWAPAEGRPVQGVADIQGTVATARADLRLDQPMVLESDVTVTPDWQRTAFHITGIGTDSPVNNFPEPKSPGVYIRQLICRTLGGWLTVDGRLRLAPEPFMGLSIRAEQIDPGVMLPNWPGELALQSDLTVRLSGRGMDIDLADLGVQGLLVGQPVAVSGRLALHGQSPYKVNLAVRSGRNQLKLNTPEAGADTVGFDLDVPEPENLWPGLQGTWQGNGSVRFFGHHPAGVLSLVGRDAAYGNFRAKRLSGNITYDGREARNCSAKVAVTALQVDRQTFPRITLDWRGELRDHTVTAVIDGPKARLDLSVQGQCRSDTWDLNFKQVAFDLGHEDHWLLKRSPLRVRMDRTGIAPFSACWSRRNAEACLHGAWSAQRGWTATGDVYAPPFDRVLGTVRVLAQSPRTLKRYYTSGDITYE